MHQITGGDYTPAAGDFVDSVFLLRVLCQIMDSLHKDFQHSCFCRLIDTHGCATRRGWHCISMVFTVKETEVGQHMARLPLAYIMRNHKKSWEIMRNRHPALATPCYTQWPKRIQMVLEKTTWYDGVTHRISKTLSLTPWVCSFSLLAVWVGLRAHLLHGSTLLVASLRRTLQLRHHRTNMTDLFLTETIHRCSPNRWMNLALAKDHLDPLAACHSLAQRSFHSISALDKDELQ